MVISGNSPPRIPISYPNTIPPRHATIAMALAVQPGDDVLGDITPMKTMKKTCDRDDGDGDGDGDYVGGERDRDGDGDGDADGDCNLLQTPNIVE